MGARGERRAEAARWSDMKQAAGSLRSSTTLQWCLAVTVLAVAIAAVSAPLAWLLIAPYTEDGRLQAQYEFAEQHFDRPLKCDVAAKAKEAAAVRGDEEAYERWGATASADCAMAQLYSGRP